MEFKSGDEAVHPGYGLGNIVRLEEREMAGAAKCWYYVLAMKNTTIWVPVCADGSNILRAVTAKRELDQYRTLLKSRPARLEHDSNKRRLEVNQHLKPGSFRVMCEGVRDLTACGWYRPLGEIDTNLLQKVRDNLRREWAAASGLSMPEAILEVDALLQAGREAYKSQTLPAAATPRPRSRIASV